MEQYANVVQDLAGNVVPSAFVRVLSENGVTDAEIYDASGARVSNPVPVDSTGGFAFMAANGKYFAQVEVDGRVYKKLGPITLFDFDDVPKTDRGYVAVSYNDINDILDATTGFVAIRVPEGRFAVPTEDRIREMLLDGDVGPSKSEDKTRLENGSVMEGSFISKRKNGVKLRNIGIDRGQEVCNRLFGGVKADALVITSWDGVAGNIYPDLIGCEVENVIGLIPENTTANPSLFHAVLLEGFGSTCRQGGTIEGVGGIASVVIKCNNITTGHLKGTLGAPYTVVVKSNNYAPCHDLIIPSVTSRGGGVFAFVTDDETVGAPMARISVGPVDLQDCQFGVRTDSASGRPISDIHIDRVNARGIVGNGIQFKGPNTMRISMDSHYTEGCGIGVTVENGAQDISIGSGKAIGCPGFGYFIDANGTTAGDIEATYSGGAGIVTNTVDFTVNSATGSDNGGGTFGGSARPLTVSSSEFWGATMSDGVTQNATVQLSVSSKFKVSIANGVVSATEIASGRALFVLPAQLRPFTDKLLTTVALVGGQFTTQPISIGAADGVVVYRGVAATQVYLSGTSYDLR